MSSDRIQRRINRLLGQVREAADRSDWEVSRKFAEDILAVEPSNKDAQAYIASELQLKIGRLLAQALTAADREDWEESLRYSEAILALDPDNVDAQAYIASALQNNIERTLSQAKQAADLSDWESSMLFAKMALSLDPDNAIAQSYLTDAVQGKVEHLLDKVEEAADRRDWEGVRLLTEEILAIDRGNGDAETYSDAAYRMIDKSGLPKGLSDDHQKGHYEIVLDSVSGVVTIRGDKLTDIPKDEFVILASLYRNRGRTVNLEQIRAECGSVFYSPSSFKTPSAANQTIERCIRSLRQKIEEDPSNPKIILDVGDSGSIYIIAPIVEYTDTVSDTEDTFPSELADAPSGPESPIPLMFSELEEKEPTEEHKAPLEDDVEQEIQTQISSPTLEEGSQQLDQVTSVAPSEKESADGDLAMSEDDSEQEFPDQTSSLTQGEAGEQVGPIVWAAIRNDLGYGIPWVSDQEDVSADLPTVRLGWEVANAVAVGISEYLQTNFNVVEDPDEWFHLIYEDVEIEVESWDGTTAEVVALASEYFAPWYKALEDIVETAIPNIAKGVVDSLEVTEIQVDKMLETIHAASEHFTHKWIDNSVDSIVEVGLGKVEGLVREFLGDESDDIDVDQAGTDARTEIQPDVMQAVSWFISDAQSTLSPKLGDSYDTVSDELLTALESIGPIAKKSTSIELPDTSWGDDILSSVFDTTSS